MALRIQAEITARDNASAVVNSFGKNVEAANGKMSKSTDTLRSRFTDLVAITASAGIGFHKLTGLISSSVDAANRSQAALIGLTSVARAFGHDIGAANKAAQDLASDGLLTLGDAALGLKNLLAAGFNLDQAVKLMTRFKDSAAFGRQAALSFGQAVTSATEGIKNGNSILVDNAGVTKNLSVILQEAGFSAQDLMKATTDANVRMALFKGIIKETNPQLGDASRLTETYAGKQAMLNQKTTILRQQIGEALQPALLKLLEAITPIVVKVTAWIERNPKLTAALILVATAVTGLITVLGALAIAFGPIMAGFRILIGLVKVFRGLLLIKPLAMAFMTAMSGQIGGAVVAVSGKFRALRGLMANTGWWKLGLQAGVVAATIWAVGNIIGAIRSAQGALQALRNAADAEEGRARAVTTGLARYQAALRAGTTTQANYDAYLKSIGSPGAGSQVKNAMGGSVMGGRTHLVGEKGPELFVPPGGGGSIVPNHELQGGGGVNLTVNIGMFSGSRIERRRVAETIYKDLLDIANRRNTTISNLIPASN